VNSFTKLKKETDKAKTKVINEEIEQLTKLFKNELNQVEGWKLFNQL